MSRAGAVTVRLLLVVLVAGSMSVGCASTGAGPDREALARRIAERERYTAEQARCLSRRIIGSYAPDEARSLYEEGPVALPEARWGSYVRFVGHCVLREELTVAEGPGRATSSTGGPGS